MAAILIPAGEEDRPTEADMMEARCARKGEWESAAIPTDRTQSLGSLRVGKKGEFPLCLSVSEEMGMVAVGLTDCGVVVARIAESGSLHFHRSFSKLHQGRVRDVRFPLRREPWLLYTCGEDGSIFAKSAKTGREIESARTTEGGKRAWSVDVGLEDGSLLAVGTDDSIELWRRRGRNKGFITTFHEAFCEPVTCVRFHPTERHMLAASSMDGLVSMFDLSHGFDDYEGLVSVCSIGADIASFDFFGSDLSCIWAITRVEELSLWHTDGSWLGQVVNTRKQMSSQVPGNHRILSLVACDFDPETGTLYAAGSTQNGDLVWFSLDLQQSKAPEVLNPVVRLRQQHEDVIRCAYALQSDVAGVEHITAGEDGFLCTWGCLH